MKTAGSFVNSALVKEVFGPRRYTIYQARRFGHDRDWLPEELLDIVRSDESPAYVHSHSRNWTAEVFEAARAGRWLTMCYLRNPADQWCSYYFWSQEKHDVSVVARFELDEFLHKVFSGHPDIPATLHDDLDPPDYWPDIDVVAEYTDDHFVQLMSDLFDVTYEPGDRRNVSSNRGYDQYRADGLVSDETHALIAASPKMQLFEKIRSQPSS